MYLPDKLGARAAASDALRAGGRYAAIVFSEPERNRFFSVPISIIRRERRAAAARARASRGRSRPTNLAELLEEAGFREVRGAARSRRRCGSPSAAECARLERESFGALHQMLAEPRRAGARGDLGRDRGRAARSSRARPGSPARANCWCGAGTRVGRIPSGVLAAR